MITRQYVAGLAVAAVASLFSSQITLAQDYPTRPVTMVVPFPAGGPSDAIGRIVAEGMRGALGQPIIVENIFGATGTIGAARVARATGDGYTIGIGNWASHVLSGAIYPLQYDALTDLQPVSLLADTPYWIVAKSTLPPKNLTELIAWLQGKPAGASVGTVGAASGSNLCAIDLQQGIETHFQFVPYRGTAPAMQDLLAGHIDFMCDIAAGWVEQVRAGTVRAYAVTSKNRWAAAPDTPTVDEAGLPGLYISAWTGLWAPKGTPPPVIAKLNAAVVIALADQTVRARLTDLGQELPPRERQTPEALGIFQKAEMEKWWPIIKAANVKSE
jgi:tripartite-type tricarboxylate transporter receptor subunit TctC